MWNCGVLLLCVFVMVPQGALCKFTDVNNFKDVDSRGGSFRRPQPTPSERWQQQARPKSLTPTMSKEFKLKLQGFKHNKTCPDNETCASKCCPIGQGFDFSEDRCRALSREFNPLVKSNYSGEKELNVSKEFHILEGKIGCSRNKKGKKEYKRLVSALKRDFHLLTNGSLFMESDRAAGPGMIFDVDKYCIDLFITADKKPVWDAVICHIPRPFKRHRDLTIACILITCILVLLRVVTFACLPELRTLHGKILLAYLISFFVALLLMANKMFLMNGNKINREACSILSFIVYFFTQLAFFWRNVMCYDIWWTFSGKRAKSGRGSSSRTRFCLYCAYAFGWPIALTVLMIALEYSGLSDEHVLMPKVRQYGCKGLDEYAKLIYYYGPILTLFVINIVLFALTALKIAAIKKETRTVLKSKESGTHDRKNDVERFTLYVNLFASMLFLEVNWLLDGVTIFYPDARNVSIITDFCNLAILLFIFVNFVRKKRTWIMIKKRYQHMRGLSSGLTTVTSTNRTMTSQTSQISQISLSQDTVTTEQWNPAVSQNETQSPDFIREKSSLVESQEDKITNEYSRDSHNPAVSQDDIQSSDFKRRKSSPAESQSETQSLDVIQKNSSPAESQEVTQSPNFIRKKSSPAGRQDNTQSLNYSQEKSSPAENQKETQSLDFIREKSSPVEIQDNTQSPDFMREKSSRAESQEYTQSLDFIREKLSPAEGQEYTRSLDFIRGKPSPAKSKTDSQSLEFTREKASLAESQEYTQSSDFIRENSSPAENQEDTQSLDFIRENSSPAENQEDTQSLDFIRENSSPVEIQDNTQSPDFMREKSSRAESQEYTQSLDFIREKLSPAESQEYTRSLEFIREKASLAESQEYTQSSGFIRENSSPTENQEDTQSLDFIFEKSSQAESHEDTLSLDFIREKSSPAEFQKNTQSPDVSRHKTFPNEEPDDTQAPEIIVETKQTMLIASNALYQPTSFERSRTLPRPGVALNHLTAVEKRQSLLRRSLRHSSIDTDGATFQLFKGSV